jgi:hypothetical protein
MALYISSQANRFLQHKQDYDWLISPCSGKQGIDTFYERVVYTTFPSDLAKSDFEEYIDRKFSILDSTNREKIKALYKANKDLDLEKNVTFDYGVNGAITATLTMMLFERAGDELKISVGYINYTRQPTTGWHHLPNYWQSNTDKVVKALQYKYGLELQRELS